MSVERVGVKAEMRYFHAGADRIRIRTHPINRQT
jgi:hypothetical protein